MPLRSLSSGTGKVRSRDALHKPHSLLHCNSPTRAHWHWLLVRLSEVKHVIRSYTKMAKAGQKRGMVLSFESSVRWSMSWDVVSLSSQLLTPLFIRIQSCPEVHFCPYSNLVFTTAICSNMVLTCFNLIQFLPLCNSVLSDKELWSMC